TVVIRMAVSKINEGAIWTASDDGMVFLTRDDGQDWEDVTPKGLKKNSKIVEIIESSHDAATAYIAVTRLKGDDDRRPYLYKTTNYGKDWASISESFPQDQITRTICEDSVRKGLLFVGTETGIFFSLNDGESWQRMDNGFPRTPVYHIIQKDEDLVVASHGRGLWVLDDVSPLRVMTDGPATNGLVKPRDTY
ncbi:MAG: glycosyl hydrolase, partial [Planctomycetes bacterium]|nr:glycosyl hydrolase [Planctomycetota bacterium]